MGAIFGVFAAFYFWVGKITGYSYNETLGKIHFWTMFIGVKYLALIEFYIFKMILFDTRNSYWIEISKTNNNSKILAIFILIYSFSFNESEDFLLTNYYLIAQLVGVNNIRLDSFSMVHNQYENIKKAPQRLNTKDLFWLVGFIDGDGCLSYYKEKKYDNWRHEVEIGLTIKDIKLLYKIKKLLGCGIVYKHNNVAIFRIKKINHLLTVILPILDNYPLLTENKRINYLKFRDTLLNKIIHSKRSSSKEKQMATILFDNTPKIYNFYNINIESLLNSIELPSDYFINWIVFYKIKRRRVTTRI